MVAVRLDFLGQGIERLAQFLRRQRGRLQAASVINCELTRPGIAAALQQLYSPAFQASLKHVRNPYGDGGASQKIVEVLKNASLNEIVKKRFYDCVLTCE